MTTLGHEVAVISKSLDVHSGEGRFLEYFRDERLIAVGAQNVSRARQLIGGRLPWLGLVVVDANLSFDGSSEPSVEGGVQVVKDLQELHGGNIPVTPVSENIATINRFTAEAKALGQPLFLPEDEAVMFGGSVRILKWAAHAFAAPH